MITSMMNKKIKEKVGFYLLALLTLMALVPVFFILAYLVWKGGPAISWEFITQSPRRFLTEGGVFPAIIGTLSLALGTILIAIPLGVGTAIYLVEYAKESFFTKLIRIAIINLAGVPSVVYGLFGLGLFVMTLNLGRSLAAGVLTLGILTLPIIIASAEEALLAVPDEYRHASLALGATPWQTISRVVLPVAFPSILTGAILGIGRAMGETAPIMFTAAAIYIPGLPRSIFDQVMALPYHLYAIATEFPNVPEHMAFGTALVLLVMVGSINLVAVVLRARARVQRMR